MKTLVHISDLHFGRIDERMPGPLALLINELAPDVIAVSGDLTQRAKPRQFIQARQWLDHLNAPKIVVPGNHDISLYNPIKRFMGALDAYRTHISQDIEPTYEDDEIAVLGINSARSLTFKGGRINQEQLLGIRERSKEIPSSKIKIVVSHHPFSLDEDADEDDIIGRSQLGMRVFHEVGVDILLAGHMHESLAANTAKRYPIEGYAALVVQAGTATSTRGRGESNSFNLLRLGGKRADIFRYHWNDALQTFVPDRGRGFARGVSGWQPEKEPSATAP